ncbi:H+-transporting ATPase [Fusarium tjaetaba]|uniref:H+-transporting ATPase n=1 Tax=Fusarium tjaetaba TaxID=1567544 RepID=A0A8H5RLP1_9HYPO|nr:H+-transporting ATPase [Fusarium tjaetaba]KAF5635578.1 H+-transporting ATPase [Fusarium tjaetaba]
MGVIGLTASGLVGALHSYILVLEMFLWTKPRGRKAFRLTPEFAEQTKIMAANQGLYNGFLSAGLIWSLLHPNPEFSKQLQIFFNGCVLVAGAYGGLTANKKILYIQAAPAALSLGLVLRLIDAMPGLKESVDTGGQLCQQRSSPDFVDMLSILPSRPFSQSFGDWVDFRVVVGILMLNAFVGFYQEKQAADVVASLKATNRKFWRENLFPETSCSPCLRLYTPEDFELYKRLRAEGKPDRSDEGDARLIYDYTRPEDFELYKRLRAEDKLGRSDEEDDIICDYTSPEDFELYIRLRAEDKLDRSDEEDEFADGADKEQDHDTSTEHDAHQHSQEQEPHDYRNRPLAAIDQSAITGESLAVEKYLGDMVYYTTGCKRGKAFALVQTTAKESFVGRTADLVQGAKDQGHFKAIINNSETSLLVLVIFWILIAWIAECSLLCSCSSYYYLKAKDSSLMLNGRSHQSSGLHGKCESGNGEQKMGRIYY